MDLKYYVLGIKDSSLIKEYKDKFYNKLISDLNKLKRSGILANEIEKLLQVENKEFILNPDQSSIINFLLININVNDEKYYSIVDIFKKEIDIFLYGNIEDLIMNKGQHIAGTDIKLTSSDNNPYNIQEAHPEHKEAGAISGNWGEASEKQWLESYTKTFKLLKDLDEGVYDELNQIIKKIVPLGTSKGNHNSASYKECVGHLYMGYTIDSNKPELNNLEALIHESSHNKLNLLMQFDPCLLNSKEEKYYSPVRPDARHLHGIFLAIHAFVPTIYMLMKAYRSGFMGSEQHWFEKLVLYYIKNKVTWKVLKKHAQFTQLGEEIMEEVKYVMGLCDDLFKEIAPSSEVIFRAKQRQIEHFKAVNFNYPYLEY